MSIELGEWSIIIFMPEKPHTVKDLLLEPANTKV